MEDAPVIRDWPKDAYKMPCINKDCDSYIYLICTSAPSDDSVFPPLNTWLFGALDIRDKNGECLDELRGQYRCDKCGYLNVFRFAH